MGVIKSAWPEVTQVTGRLQLQPIVLAACVPVVIIVGGLALLIARSGDAPQPEVGLTAAAALESPNGEPVGTVTFLQAPTGVLIMADVKGLPPGGHAFIVHEFGSCTPDFDAAGDHFNPHRSAARLYPRILEARRIG